MNNNDFIHECDPIEVGAASEQMHECSQTQTITREQYQIFLNATVELYKANAKIKKLESVVAQKDIKIGHLKTQLEAAKQTLVEDFSPVNIFCIYKLVLKPELLIFKFITGTK